MRSRRSQRPSTAAWTLTGHSSPPAWTSLTRRPHSWQTPGRLARPFHHLGIQLRPLPEQRAGRQRGHLEQGRPASVAKSPDSLSSRAPTSKQPGYPASTTHQLGRTHTDNPATPCPTDDHRSWRLRAARSRQSLQRYCRLRPQTRTRALALCHTPRSRNCLPGAARSRGDNEGYSILRNRLHARTTAEPDQSLRQHPASAA